MVALLLGGATSLHAQFDSASILGTVHDSTGAAVPNAKVTLFSIAKGLSTERQTGSSGDYEFPNVAPGDYRIVATSAGFQQTSTDKFTVNVAARQRVDLTLSIGAASDTVTVSGAATALETDTSDRGETVQGAEAVDLPLNGRSYADLSALVPGVRKSLLDTVASNPPRDASYNVNGLTSQSNNFELDGIDNNAYQEANQGYSNQAVIPSPDAIQEFKVQTDNYSAEYGRAGGAIINATTRSGTNAFHGGAYDYLRNTDLNAFGPFLGTGVKPTLVQNQFGATFGGPVWKDKVFFFADYEGLRSVAHLLTTATLPTAAELSGLFTSDGTATGTPVPLKNPYTGVVYANGQIPLNDPNIDPVALAALKDLPLPNIANAPVAGTNFQYLPASTTTDDKGDGRVDFTRNDRQNGFFRYSQRAVQFFQPPNYPGPAGGNNNGTLYARTRQLAAGYNWAVTLNSILEFRFGQTWTESGKSPVFLGAPNFLAGIPNVPQDPSYTGGLNTQTVSGFTAFGEQATNPQFTNPTQANPKVNYTWIKGKHSLKVGYEYGLLLQAISDFHPKFGSDTYAGGFSSGGSTAKTATQAAGLADFLFGARNNYQLNSVNEVNYKRFWHMGYVQDDWKFLPNLTINAGLRYEFVAPNTEQDNKILNFDPVNQQLLHAGTGTNVLSTAPGHVYSLHYVGGSSLADRGLVNPDYKDFGPRLGFSYEPIKGTVVRAGYGISYAYLFRFGGEGLLAYNGPNNYNATINQSPLTEAVCTSLTQDPATCFRRTQDGYQTNFAGPTNFSTVKAQTRYVPKGFKNAYVQAYHISVQQQLPMNFTAEISYVGNHAVHVPALEDTNQARRCLASEIPLNPKGVGGYSGTCSTPLLNRRPIANFTDILTETNAGFLDYNSLQTKLERRFSNGIYLINSFTWSKGINNSSADLEANNGDGAVVNIANPGGDRGLSGYNQKLNDTTSVIAAVPFGRGRRFGNAIPGWQQEILGGWELTGINTVASGVPIDVTYTASTNQVVSTTSSVYSLRPNLTSNVKAIYGTTSKTVSALNGYFLQSAVSVPSPTQLFGNAPRNAFVGPAFGSFDLAAHKKFDLLSDHQTLEFRIEAFNVLNATNYISPNASIGSVNSTSGVFSPNGSFGQFTGATSVFPSRQVQLALRLAF
jgi:hypothetical protein